MAVKAYADYKPALALKYVRNVMDRHSKDGLAFQRYGRVKQDGLGDDILSGNSLSVVGLYQAIYGINPLYNRFYLNPHITTELAGTALKYNFRGRQLTISLNMNRYAVSNKKYKIISNKHFGFYGLQNELSYFDGNNAVASLVAKTDAESDLTLDIKEWGADEMVWLQTSTGKHANKLKYTICQLTPGISYTITINGKSMAPVKSNAEGTIIFNHNTSATPGRIVIAKE